MLKSCTIQLYNFSAHEKPTGNDCAGVKVNSAQLEITVQSAFGAAQFIDFTLVGESLQKQKKRKKNLKTVPHCSADLVASRMENSTILVFNI